MPDLLLDTRPVERRSPPDPSTLFRWSPRLRARAIDTEQFRLVLTWCEPDALWEPATNREGAVCAVTGFLALDEEEWTSAEAGSSDDLCGGLAARAVHHRYRERGTPGWDHLSGNCAIVLFDPVQSVLHLRTDPAGCFPVFGCVVDGYPVWASHPDVLAAVVDRAHRVDELSLAEFIQASTVTPPWTYYQGIEAWEAGSVFTLDLRTRRLTSRRYFSFEYRADPNPDPDALAEELAAAWRKAVRRRSLPRLGRIAVALSGGLDSRLVLGCMNDPSRAFAFTCYDAPNRELATARAIARAAGAGFHPIQRSTDYYGEHAPMGVRVSGGMGTFANNHFLGVLEPLQAAGQQMLLTGCYCDYLFKGLPLNRRIRFWDGHEVLAPYRHQFYFDHWVFETPLATRARERWDVRFPPELRQDRSDPALFRIETLRTFPLYHEGDNQQRLVPQRLVGWSPPATDLEVLKVYCRVPSRLKLNRDLFLRTARRLLANSPLIRVPDANTGAPLNAPAWREALSWQWLRFQRKLRFLRTSIASDGSWPDWTRYYRQSPALEHHWRCAGTDLHDLILRVTGWRRLPERPADFPPEQCFLFVPLLTLKLWWEHRACSGGSPN